MRPCILAHAGNANTAVSAMTVNQRSNFDAGFGSPCFSTKTALHASRGIGASLAQFVPRTQTLAEQ